MYKGMMLRTFQIIKYKREFVFFSSQMGRTDAINYLQDVKQMLQYMREQYEQKKILEEMRNRAYPKPQISQVSLIFYDIRHITRLFLKCCNPKNEVHLN